MSSIGEFQLLGSLYRLREWRSELGVGTGLVVLATIWSLTAPNFLSATNITLLFQQMAVLMIIAVGETFVMLGGEIDLSVGATVGLTTVLLAVLTVQFSWPLVLAVGACFAVGAIIGTFTGMLKNIWNIPSFIITLGLLASLRGIAFTLTNGVTVAPVPAALSFLWSGRLLRLPMPIWIMFVIVSAALWVLHRTRFGRHVYAVGNNIKACRRYGINVRAIRIVNFVVIQVLAVCGGLLYAAELSSGNATVGKGLELNVIAGVVVGGVSLFGGVGRLAGTVVGLLFIATLSNGLELLGVSSYVFLIAQGAVVIAAVWFSALQRGGERDE